MKVTKVYRVLKFASSPWLKEYIDFNTSKRTQVKMILRKIFFKLMNNSAYGKTMENLRNRVNVRLFTNYDKHLREVAKGKN